MDTHTKISLFSPWPPALGESAFGGRRFGSLLPLERPVVLYPHGRCIQESLAYLFTPLLQVDELAINFASYFLRNVIPLGSWSKKN